MAAISNIYLSNSAVVGVGAAGQTAAGGTFSTIGGIYSGTLTVSHNVIDTTNSTDAGQTSMLLGNTTWTLSLECRYDPTDAGQAVLRNVGSETSNGSYKGVKAFSVQPIGTSNEEYSFDGFVTSFSINPGENDNSVNLSVEIQSSGPSNHTAALYDSDGAA
jgi:predicted secreted protein